ncbi:MAG: hypothetical protein JWO05_351 [Gemmatimonadetes bacterium]|nr:hypothetical protein [Gemmatimonadota bacterium]
MAEIHIVRRRRRHAWPWFLLLMAPLVWLALPSAHRESASAGDVGEELLHTAPIVAPSQVARARADTLLDAPDASAVAAFASYVDRASAMVDEPSSRRYASGALQRLANAIAQTALVPESSAQLRNVRAQATSLRETATSKEGYADMAQSASLAAAAALEQSPKTGARVANAVALARRAAEKVKGGPTVFEQRASLLTFLQASRVALEAMAGGA